MAHLDYQPSPRSQRVPDQWLAATASVTEWLIALTNKYHIAAKVGPNLAKGAGTAMYIPALAEVQINADTLLPGVRPQDVNFGCDLFRARHPLAAGAAAHEAAHAAYSRWVPADLKASYRGDEISPRHAEILVALEEHRIEWALLKSSMADQVRSYLPAIVFDLLARDLKPDVAPSVYSASIVAALVLARADAGIVSEEEARPFAETVALTLDEDIVAQLRALWRRYRVIPFSTIEGVSITADQVDEMIDIANAWLRVLAEAQVRAETEPKTPGKGEPGKGEPGEAEAEAKSGEGETGEAEAKSGEGETGEAETESGGAHSKGASDADVERALDEIVNGETVLQECAHSDKDKGHDPAPAPVTDSEPEASRDYADAIREAAKQAKHVREMDALDDVRAIKAERAKRRRELTAQRHRHAAKAFRDADKFERKFKRVGPRSAYRPRQPSAAERTAATSFARRIADAVVVEPSVARVATTKPGTKLRTRALVQRRAQERQGLRPTARHWEGKARTVAENPTVRVGVAVDISGSMNALAEPLALSAYIIGNGLHKAGGHFAQTTFGDGAFNIVNAGRPVDIVPVVEPHDSTEDISKAVLSLDHQLDLVDGDGVRVLIVASDGHFVDSSESDWAKEMFPALVESGVILLHLDFGGHVSELFRHNNPIPPVVIPDRSPPQAVAKIIGDRIIEEVEALNARQGKEHARGA